MLKDPLMRAFRLDKMTLAALEATLRIYLNEERALREIPTLRMLSQTAKELRPRAQDMAAKLCEIRGVAAVVVADDVAYVGGGSLPDQTRATVVLELEATGISDAELASRLRMQTPAVMARVRDGKLVLDVRTILPEEQEPLLAAMAASCISG